MRSSVAWKSQPPTAPLIVGPGAAIGTHVNEDSFSTGLIQAAPMPTGSAGSRVEAGTQLSPLSAREAFGRHVLHFLGLVVGVRRHHRERQGRQETEAETN